jgi:hypothetical protein
MGIGYLVARFERLAIDPSGRLTVLFYAYVLCFIGYRFWRIIKEQSNGTLSEEKYRANPAMYFMGPFWPRTIWMCIGVAIVLAYIFFMAFEGLK